MITNRCPISTAYHGRFPGKRIFSSFITTLSFILLLESAVPLIQAQQPTPAPSASTQESDSLRLVIEEVQLAVAAFDEDGRRDPTFGLDDILILEDDIAQQIKSVRRVPASVLLVIDTGNSEVSFKRIDLIREIARTVISNLDAGDEVAVLEFNTHVELLQPWTKEPSEAIRAIDSKLFSGKRSRLSDAIMAAVNLLRDRPVENRHVIMITDGVETPANVAARTKAIEGLIESRATVSVICYTEFGRQTAVQRRRLTRRGVISPDAKYVDLMLPGGRDWELMRAAKTTPSWITVYLDKEMRQRVRAYEAEAEISGQQLTELASKTGGRIWLPESEGNILEVAEDVARSINSYYVITFKPKRPLSTSAKGEYRRINVASRRVGLHVRVRKGYFTPAGKGQ